MLDRRRERTEVASLGMSPGCTDDSAGASVVAATGVENRQLLFFCNREIVAVMNVLANAACMRTRRDRERQRSERSD
jgi:hypothetical protein